MKFTLEEFRGLPLTISMKQFCAWSGLPDYVIRDMANCGQIRRVNVSRGKRDRSGDCPKSRYLKIDLARICGLEL